MQVRINRATSKDAGTVAEIGRRTFYETWKSVNTEEDLQQYMTISFDPEKIRVELSNTSSFTFLLIYVDEVLAGYAKLRNDRTCAELKDQKALELERIYVLKEFQDKKIGKALMDESIRISQEGGYDWIWLGVNQENFKAIEFYKRYGFEVFGTKKFILGTAVDDDFLMKMKLRGNPIKSG